MTTRVLPSTTVEYAPWTLPLRRPLVIAASATPLQQRRGVLVRVTRSDGDCRYGDACPLPGLSRDHYDDVIAAFAGRMDAPQPPSLDWALYAAQSLSTAPRSLRTAYLLGDDIDSIDSIDSDDAFAAVADGATVKLKVGRRALADDLRRVAAVVAVVRQLGEPGLGARNGR